MDRSTYIRDTLTGPPPAREIGRPDKRLSLDPAITGPDPAPSAVAALVKVPWDQANQKHTLRLELLDADGQPVTLPSPDETEQPLLIEAEFVTRVKDTRYACAASRAR